jgi:hypothetical protein
VKFFKAWFITAHDWFCFQSFINIVRCHVWICLELGNETVFWRAKSSAWMALLTLQPLAPEIILNMVVNLFTLRACHLVGEYF